MVNRPILHRTAILLIAVCLFAIVACERDRKDPDLRIAVAANAQFAMKEMIRVFSGDSLNCEMIVGSTGQLANQILQGAPFDMFFSADVEHVQKLLENERIVSDVRFYAEGELIIASRTLPAPTLEDVAANRVNKVALADPDLAPYGKAAIEVLKNSGLYNSVRSKLVFAPSVAHVNQMVASGAADIGFLAASSLPLFRESEKEINYSGIADWFHTPLTQAFGVVKRSRFTDAFAAFVLGADGQEILHRYGYRSPGFND